MTVNIIVPIVLLAVYIGYGSVTSAEVLVKTAWIPLCASYVFIMVCGCAVSARNQFKAGASVSVLSSLIVFGFLSGSLEAIVKHAHPEIASLAPYLNMYLTGCAAACIQLYWSRNERLPSPTPDTMDASEKLPG